MVALTLYNIISCWSVCYEEEWKVLLSISLVVGYYFEEVLSDDSIIYIISWDWDVVLVFRIFSLSHRLRKSLLSKLWPWFECSSNGTLKILMKSFTIMSAIVVISWLRITCISISYAVGALGFLYGALLTEHAAHSRHHSFIPSAQLTQYNRFLTLCSELPLKSFHAFGSLLLGRLSAFSVLIHHRSSVLFSTFSPLKLRSSIALNKTSALVTKGRFPVKWPSSSPEFSSLHDRLFDSLKLARPCLLQWFCNRKFVCRRVVLQEQAMFDYRFAPFLFFLCALSEIVKIFLLLFAFFKQINEVLLRLTKKTIFFSLFLDRVSIPSIATLD